MGGDAGSSPATKIEEDEPEFSKAELIQSQVDDWRGEDDDG